jgi:nucleotide-binding universal stress UspA family protein
VVVNSRRGGRDPDPNDASDADAELEAVHAELTEAGLEHEVRQVIRGTDPADDLIKVAVEVAAEFIVIGLRRRSPVGKLILGSSAQRVLLDAPCPVLAVKSGE